jgi:hypothetical protein
MAPLEWLKHTDTVQTVPRRTRLKDTTSALLCQYYELLRNARVDGEIRQQTGQLRSSVSSASIVQSASTLMKLSDELQCASMVGDHVEIEKEIANVTTSHERFEVDGTERLRTVCHQMHQALRELESSFYSRKHANM